MEQDEDALLREIHAEAARGAQARRRRLYLSRLALLVIAGGLVIALGYQLTALLVHWRMGG